MKLKYFIPLVSKDFDIRVYKAGYPLLFSGNIQFTPKKLLNENIENIIFIYYEVRQLGNTQKKFALQRPYLNIFLISDREPIVRDVKAPVGYKPPSSIDAEKQAQELGIDYFDDDDE